jgi:hypothetical protein
MSNTDLIKQLENTKNELLARVSQIDETILTIKAMHSFNGNLSNGTHTMSNAIRAELPEKYKSYDAEAAMKTKLVFVLKAENRFLHIKEIAKKLHDLEPEISEEDFIKKLYPAVAVLKKGGVIVKYDHDTTNFNSFWGSKNWLDAGGKIKPEHMFDEKQLKNFSKEAIEI